MKKFVLVFLFLFLLGNCFALAATPVLYFSDLTDGPRSGWNGSATKGAAVTIWGQNFGSSRGSSYVTVAGQNLTSDSDYAEWGVSANNARGLERITFYLKSACTSGAQTISVTTSSGTSSTIPFYVRTSGAIRFVDHTNGNNANNGQTDTSAWRTLPYAKTQISGGTILYVRAGSYTELDDYSRGLNLDGPRAGSANAMTGIIGYPGEFPVLDTRTAQTSYDCIGTNENYEGDPHHYTIAKLICYPYGGAISCNWSAIGYWRVVGVIVDGLNRTLPHESTWAGAITMQNLSYVKVLGCVIKEWGRDKYDHAIYWGANSNYFTMNTIDLEAGWNEVYNLGTETSGIYSHPVDSGTGYADEVKIHDNLVYSLSHGGIFVNSRHQDVYIYNNIVYNCGSLIRPTVQMDCPASPVSNIRFYNNTLYISSAQACLVLVNLDADNGVSNITFKNNIFNSKSGADYFDEGTGAIASDYDDYYGDGVTPAWATNALSVDPLFFNSGINDFHLQNLSPVKDAGTSDVSAVVTRDYEGVSRPQGAGYDIGAYEYAVDSTSPAAVADLAAGTVNNTTIALSWTAPGNDESVGQAASYDIRYSLANIVTDGDWNASTQVAGESVPSVAGSLEVFSVSGLSSGTSYYFALKTSDYAGNVSNISNIASAATAATVVAATDGGGGGGGGGGCFVATASYGTPFAAEVVSLSRFRDKYLLTNKPGKHLVDLYLELSPPVARFITGKEWARAVVRELLKPVVYFVRFIDDQEDRRLVE